VFWAYLQAKEVAELKEAGSVAFSERRYTRALDLFTEAIQKTAGSPDPALYFKRENFAHYTTNFVVKEEIPRFERWHKRSSLHLLKYFLPLERKVLDV